MQNINLNFIIASTVFGSFILFGFLNILLKLRKRFSVKVNCWFCNTNLRVPYDNYNSFTCVVCQQYNGFDEDGNYNVQIPAQHYSKYNSSDYCQKAPPKLNSSCNGFCEFCSRNQELKVLQLANFRARCEENYDEEIEEFRQKLEDSYQLCSQCQRHLQRTLNRVKSKFIGSKITQLKAKSADVLNQTVRIIGADDGKFVSTLIILSILILSVVNFSRDLQIEWPSTDYNDAIQAIFNHFGAFIITLRDFLMAWVKEWHMNDLLNDTNVDNLATSALLLNFLLILRDHKAIRSYSVLSMVSWAAKMISNELSIDESYASAVKGVVSSILVISSLSMLIKLQKREENPTQNANTSFQKITTDVCEESDNEFDASETNSFYDYQSSKASLMPRSNHSKMNDSFCFSKSFMSNATTRFHKSSPKTIEANKSFSIAKEVSSADRKQVQQSINRLRLSDQLNTSTPLELNSTMNPFSISRGGDSPTPSVASIFTSASQRNLISPPRLHSPQVYNGDTTHLSSWVAGGYWTSPQKKFLDAVKTKSVLSRSSSQSSGLGESEKNSRENSLAQDDTIASIFSDRSLVSSASRMNLFGKPPMFGNHISSNSSMFNAPQNFNNFRNYRDSNKY